MIGVSVSVFTTPFRLLLIFNIGLNCFVSGFALVQFLLYVSVFCLSKAREVELCLHQY